MNSENRNEIIKNSNNFILGLEILLKYKLASLSISIIDSSVLLDGLNIVSDYDCEKLKQLDWGVKNYDLKARAIFSKLEEKNYFGV